MISTCDGTCDWCWARLLGRHDQRVVFGGVGGVFKEGRKSACKEVGKNQKKDRLFGFGFCTFLSGGTEWIYRDCRRGLTSLRPPEEWVVCNGF